MRLYLKGMANIFLWFLQIIYGLILWFCELSISAGRQPLT